MFERFRKRTEPGWLVAEFGEGKARFAHVQPGARPRVAFLLEREWRAEDPKSLERAARDLHPQRYRCTTLLPQADYQMLLVDALGVRRDELKAAVRWRVKDMLDYHIDDATLDVLDIPVPAGDVRAKPMMYVVAARNDVVRRTVERFDEARVPLSVIDVPDAAQRNLAALYESTGKAVLAVSFDGEGGLLTITAAGELQLTRRLEHGYAQVNEAGGDARVFDRVLVEVQRSLDHFERTHSALAVEKVLVGPMALRERLIAHLAESLDVPVVAMRLEEIMDLPAGYTAVGAEAQARWLKLIGAGLRVEETAL